MRRAVLIYNPKAGAQRARRLVESLAGALRAEGWAAQPRPTEAPGHATELAREAAADGAEAAFALGGDGTLREVAKGILGTDVVLGPLPAGTTNVLVRSLGLPTAALAVARRAGSLRPRPFDVGLCGEEPFLMMASCGLDAAVVAKQSQAAKGKLGRAAVLAQGFGTLWSYRFPKLELEADGEPLTARQLVAANIPHYGGPFRAAPAARFDDGLLDLVLFHGKSRAATLAFAAALATGRHLKRPDVETRQVREVVLRAPAGLPLQIDGDALDAELPVTIRVAEERLSILGA